MTEKQWIGIDVSHTELKIAVPGAEKWQILSIPNTGRAIDGWVRSLDGTAAHIVLEATGSYSNKLMHALHNNNVSFSIVTPRQASQFAGVIKNITKNDERDACSLSLFGKHMAPASFVMPSLQTEQLKQWRSVLGQLKKQRHALKNQLHALQQYALPLEEAQRVLAQSIEHLDQQIAKIENQICGTADEAFRNKAMLIATVKGIGPKTALALLVATDGLKGFSDVKQLAKFVGLAPRVYQSGASPAKAHINRASDPELRTLFYMATWSACKSNKACIELRKRLKNKGKPPKVILVALAHKLLRQIWGVVKNNATFDNDFEPKSAAV